MVGTLQSVGFPDALTLFDSSLLELVACRVCPLPRWWTLKE